MKTMEERAKDSVYWDCDAQEYDVAVAQYLKGATEQKAIDRKFLAEIYDLYSALIDDLYDGYNNSNWNMGIVEINGVDNNMGEALDKLNALFNKALFPKSTEE